MILYNYILHEGSVLGITPRLQHHSKERTICTGEFRGYTHLITLDRYYSISKLHWRTDSDTEEKVGIIMSSNRSCYSFLMVQLDYISMDKYIRSKKEGRKERKTLKPSSSKQQNMLLKPTSLFKKQPASNSMHWE